MLGLATHASAAAMAKAQQEDGLFPDAVAPAGSIEAGQGAEVEQMERLLGQCDRRRPARRVAVRAPRLLPLVK